MKKKILLRAFLALFCVASLLLSGCNYILPDNNNQDVNGNLEAPDNTPSDSKPGDDNIVGDSTTDDNTNGDTNGDTNDDTNGDTNGDTNDDTNGGENNKVDLPDDYVITMSDMERFLLTKDEQYLEWVTEEGMCTVVGI